VGRARNRKSDICLAGLFTDRVSESEALTNSLRAHRAFLNTPAGPPEQSDFANNVVTFYGVGGVGKTTLSTRLEDWISGRLPDENPWGPPSERGDATVRVDLHGALGNFNPAAAVVAIRRALGTVKPRWPAFDLAFAAWWDSAHPGEQLPGTGEDRDQGFVQAVADTAQEILADLGASNVLVGFGFGITRMAIRKILEARDRSFVGSVVSDQDWYRDLLSRCAETPSKSDPHPELLIEAVDLLAMELDHFNLCPLLVIFVDAFERLQLQADHARVGEALVNQLVWNLPQALFVVTGRNRLNWDDLRRSNLSHVGHRTWPGLAQDATVDPRQHRVGDLSPEDSRSLILQANAMRSLDLGPDIVEALVEASNGLPQYLTLALEVTSNLKRNGERAASLADVTGSIGDLVDRVMENVPADEQKALRAAALFPRFDAQLIAMAAGVEVGCAERATQQSMVERWGVQEFSYRMHETVRGAIRDAPSTVAGGWSLSDWQAATKRGLAELMQRADSARQQNRPIDRMVYTGLAISLICEEEPATGEAEMERLRWAVINGPSIGGLRSYIPAVSNTAVGQGFLDYIRGAMDLPGDVGSRATLEKLAYSDHPISRNALHQLAYMFRRHDEHDDSLKVWDAAIKIDPTPLRQYQRRLTLTFSRRFEDALAGANEMDDVRQQRLRNWVDYFHGKTERHIVDAQTRFQERTEAGAAREAAEARGDYLWRESFLGERSDPQAGADLVVYSEAVGYGYGVRAGLATQLISDPLSAEAGEQFDYLADRAQTLGRPDPLWMMVRTCRAWALEDDQSLAAVAAELQSHGHMAANWIPIEVLLSHLGFPVEYPPAQWVDPFDVVQQRWLQCWHSWHDRCVRRTEIRSG
jgi:hypothetical protein